MPKIFNLDCISIPHRKFIQDHTLTSPPKPFNEPARQFRIDSTYVQFLWKNQSRSRSLLLRNCNVCQYALDTLCFNCDDIIMFVDSDVFLIKEFKILKIILQSSPCGFFYAHLGLITSTYILLWRYPTKPPRGINYFWIGLIILNMESFPNKYALNLNRGTIATPFGSGYVDTAVIATIYYKI